MKSNSNLISAKKIREINGLAWGSFKKEIKCNFFSTSFIWSIGPILIHYFVREDTNIFIPLLLLAIDVSTIVIYCVLYYFQVKTNGLNRAYKNKNIMQVNESVINEDLTPNELVAGLKIIIYLIISAILLLYYGIGGYILNCVSFMSIEDAISYCMYFLSVAYFDTFFDGTLTSFKHKTITIKEEMKNTTLIDKICLYIVLVAVVINYCFTQRVKCLIEILTDNNFFRERNKRYKK